MSDLLVADMTFNLAKTLINTKVANKARIVRDEEHQGFVLIVNVKGNEYLMKSARKETRVFKSLDAALNTLNRLGLDNVQMVARA